mgnify:CR=1 FL=1
MAIMELQTLYSTCLLCAIAGVSRSAFYKWLNKKRFNKNHELIEIIKFEHDRLRGIYGYRRMKKLLKKKYNIIVNHKKLKKILKANNLNACIRRKKPKNKLLENSKKIIAENILSRDFNSSYPGKKYVTDITYIPIWAGMVYLSLIIDLYNGEVVASKTTTNFDTSISVDIIKALSKKIDLKGAIIHSDQGVHYTNNLYCNILKEKGAIQSMSRKANCWDNAVVENFFSHFKCECVRIRKKALRTFRDVRDVVDEYIYFYNNERIKVKLNGMAPVEYRSQCI